MCFQNRTGKNRKVVIQYHPSSIDGYGLRLCRNPARGLPICIPAAEYNKYISEGRKLMNNISIRAYKKADLMSMIRIWNEVVEDGIAFPQEELLNETTGEAFFASQTYCGVAENQNTGEVLGLYILHPNNVGRCGHICNASYAVSKQFRGMHIGELLVKDCLRQGKLCGYGVLQFNAVVATNIHARHLYERLGFVQLGVIPKGFRMKDGHYEDICPYYHEL